MSNVGGRVVVPIREAVNHLNGKVNLVGVVLEFSLPTKSMGTDWYSVLKIVDASQPNPPFSVCIFTEKKDQLPLLKSAADIIVLHKVIIHQHNNEVAAHFNKRFSSFALYKGKETNNFCPYQCFGQFSLKRSEMDTMNNLWHWLSTTQLNSGTSDYAVTLNDLSKGAFFDLVCMVLHVSYEASSRRSILFVWDGTDLPPLSLVGNINEEEQNPLPLQIESVPLDWNINRQFPTLGSILRVSADDPHENIGLHFQGGRRWIRIRNMTCRTFSGMWLGILTAKSKFLLLEVDDSVVVNNIKNFEKRTRDSDRSPLWGNPPSSFTEVMLPIEWRSGTLMDIIHHKEESIFRSIVRVVAIGKHEVNDRDHKIRLTLEDATARIHALLSMDEWKFFFGGSSTIEEGNEKLKSLLGVAEHQNLEDGGERYPPWISCCIESRRDDDSGGWCYSICCTKLSTAAMEGR